MCIHTYIYIYIYIYVGSCLLYAVAVTASLSRPPPLRGLGDFVLSTGRNRFGSICFGSVFFEKS